MSTHQSELPEEVLRAVSDRYRVIRKLSKTYGSQISLGFVDDKITALMRIQNTYTSGRVTLDLLADTIAWLIAIYASLREEYEG